MSVTIDLGEALHHTYADELPNATWSLLPGFAMNGGLAAYWNVQERTGALASYAQSLGFRRLTLVNTYADYPGQQRENISTTIGKHPNNPWRKPPFFERIVRRNISIAPHTGIIVQDIEFDFEEDLVRAWSDPQVRLDSGAMSLAEFKNAYLREWATWFGLACEWVRDARPNDLCGIYGPQPFRRDYWGIAGKTSQQIDGTHARDAELWQYIDPYVDFYVASIYVFYEKPDSVYYMATNVEENYLATRKWGNRPVFAYTWLRYHGSNSHLRGAEVAPYLAQAMAIIPYFSGAKSVVLWGFEPNWRSDQGPPYQRLADYVGGLNRVARLSDKIGQGRLVIDEPAHRLWRQKRPLVRRVEITPNDCVVMAMNPWQGKNQTSFVNVKCGEAKVAMEVKGKSITLANIRNGSAIFY